MVKNRKRPNCMCEVIKTKEKETKKKKRKCRLARNLSFRLYVISLFSYIKKTLIFHLLKRISFFFFLIITKPKHPSTFRVKEAFFRIVFINRICHWYVQVLLKYKLQDINLLDSFDNVKYTYNKFNEGVILTYVLILW